MGGTPRTPSSDPAHQGGRSWPTISVRGCGLVPVPPQCVWDPAAFRPGLVQVPQALRPHCLVQRSLDAPSFWFPETRSLSSLRPGGSDLGPCERTRSLGQRQRPVRGPRPAASRTELHQAGAASPSCHLLNAPGEGLRACPEENTQGPPSAPAAGESRELQVREPGCWARAAFDPVRAAPGPAAGVYGAQAEAGTG